MKPILLTLLLPALLTAQSPARHGRDYAVFFVASSFDDRWNPLPDAPAEVDKLAGVLQNDYGFEVQVVKDATRADILRSLAAYKKKKYGPDDQLLLFFSMHGYHDPGSDRGYLIPKDGQYEELTYDSWIPHSLLAEIAGSMPCPHVLVSLDACYSGIFGHTRGKPEAASWELGSSCAAKIKKAFSAGPSRKYVAAGGDTRVPAKSAFAAMWYKALVTAPDDGLLTFTGLVAVLDQYRDPQPAWGDFVRTATGDFVFVRTNACTEELPGSNLPSGNTPANLPALEKPDAFFLLHPNALFLVQVEGGRFSMGNTAAGQKPVSVASFAMESKEVSNEEFCVFLNERGNPSEGGYPWVSIGETYAGVSCHIVETAGKFFVEKGFENFPVTFVSYFGAQAYCNWLSEKTDLTYRLPTEAEWEYAARAGKSRDVWSGTDSETDLPQYANFCDLNCLQRHNDAAKDDRFADLAPAGSFKPNSLGLFDMSGNAWEWCAPPPNSLMPALLPVRGGSFHSQAKDCLVTARQTLNPAQRYHNVGFRVVKEK